jgi:ribonuclease P protein component
MQRHARVRRRKDFAAAYRKGKIQSDRLLVVRVLANGGQTTRFGFVTGKAVGGAVIRNRVKRRLREAARALPARGGLDVVLGARKAAADASYASLAASLEQLLGRAGALAPEVDPR